MSQESHWTIRVHKTGQTPLSFFWLVPSEFCPCSGKKRGIPEYSSYLPTLFCAEVGSLAACHRQECAQLRHYKPKEKGVEHLCHSIWSGQIAPQGQCGAKSPLATRAYSKKNAPPFGVYAHNPHRDNSPFREIPQRISHTPRHAQKEEAEQKQSSAEPAAKATGSRGKTNRTITYASRSVFEVVGVGLGWSTCCSALLPLKLKCNSFFCPKLSSTYTSIVCRSVECEV